MTTKRSSSHPFLVTTFNGVGDNEEEVGTKKNGIFEDFWCRPHIFGIFNEQPQITSTLPFLDNLGLIPTLPQNIHGDLLETTPNTIFKL